MENGRFDLTRAEAVADLAEAETPAQLRQALRQYEGALAALYEGWRVALIGALARAEAAIDFCAMMALERRNCFASQLGASGK